MRLGYKISKFSFFIRASSPGFTLIELMLVVAIFAILSSGSIIFYQKFYSKNNINVAANTIVQTIRRAQVLSRAMSGNENWGVYAGSGQVLLFRGNSSTTRNSSFDEEFELPGNILTDGNVEIIFNKFSGEPNVSGTINLTSNTDESITITINSKGMVGYQ